MSHIRNLVNPVDSVPVRNLFRPFRVWQRWRCKPVRCHGESALFLSVFSANRHRVGPKWYLMYITPCESQKTVAFILADKTVFIWMDSLRFYVANLRTELHHFNCSLAFWVEKWIHVIIRLDFVGDHETTQKLLRTCNVGTHLTNLWRCYLRRRSSEWSLLSIDIYCFFYFL